MRKLPLPIAFVVVLLAGVVVGRLIRGMESESQPPLDAIEDYELRLVVGEPFPDVQLLDENGDTSTTRGLIADLGKVFLFMEMSCPPCEDMCRRWQSAIETGSVDSSSVLGIVSFGADQVADYRRKYGLAFPILFDHRHEFRDSHGVMVTPLEVIVGESGRIRSTNYDQAAPIDFEQVHAAMTN